MPGWTVAASALLRILSGPVRAWSDTGVVHPDLEPDGDPMASVQFSLGRFHLLARECGQSIEAVRPLAEALHATTPPLDSMRTLHGLTWNLLREAQLRARAAALYEVDWADAAVCVRAGMSDAETRAFLLDGGDLAPVRVLAGLAVPQ